MGRHQEQSGLDAACRRDDPRTDLRGHRTVDASSTGMRYRTPRASGCEEVGDKDVFDLEELFCDALFKVIAKDGIDRPGVSGRSIGPPVVAEYGAIGCDEVAEPVNHRVHVVEDEAVLLPVDRRLLCVAEALIDRRCQTGMLGEEIFSDDYGVHDRKDAGALEIGTFHLRVIREESRDRL